MARNLSRNVNSSLSWLLVDLDALPEDVKV